MAAAALIAALCALALSVGMAIVIAAHGVPRQ